MSASAFDPERTWHHHLSRLRQPKRGCSFGNVRHRVWNNGLVFRGCNPAQGRIWLRLLAHPAFWRREGPDDRVHARLPCGSLVHERTHPAMCRRRAPHRARRRSHVHAKARHELSGRRWCRTASLLYGDWRQVVRCRLASWISSARFRPGADLSD